MRNNANYKLALNLVNLLENGESNEECLEGCTLHLETLYEVELHELNEDKLECLNIGSNEGLYDIVSEYLDALESGIDSLDEDELSDFITTLKTLIELANI